MKKKYCLLLFVFLLSITVKAQTSWLTVKLDNKMAVNFPVEPEKKIGNGTVNFTSKTADSVIHIVGVMDYKIIANIDSAGLAPLKDTQTFADQIRAGVISQRKNYNFGNITIGKWKTFTTYTMAGTKSTDKSRVSMKMILIGSKMYGFTCLIPDQLASKNDEVFFDSVKLL